MKKKRQFALNKLFNVCVASGSFLLWISIELFIEGEIALGIGFGIAALLFIILPAIFTPFCYSFDSDGVSLRYIFLPTERYLWNDIYSIEVEFKRSGRASVLDFFYASVFAVEGNNVGKRRFYMKGNIRKSFRTKHLLEKYWDGTITGYFFEDVKNRIDKQNAERQSQINEHITDEIVPMERGVRAETRELLKPFIAEAKQHDLDIKAEYFYITKDFEEHRSRPKEGYTYTLIAEIAHFNETDEDRIAVLSVDLLHVRLGKKAYRGVYNERAKEELHSALSNALSEIYKIGIEAYCNGETGV